MDRKSSPTVFGIIAIICSLPLLVVSAESIHIFSTTTEDMYINPGDINYGEAQLIGGLGFILLTIIIILLASGICALRRKM